MRQDSSKKFEGLLSENSKLDNQTKEILEVAERLEEENKVNSIY